MLEVLCCLGGFCLGVIIALTGLASYVLDLGRSFAKLKEQYELRARINFSVEQGYRDTIKDLAQREYKIVRGAQILLLRNASSIEAAGAIMQFVTAEALLKTGEEEDDGTDIEHRT